MKEVDELETFEISKFLKVIITHLGVLLYQDRKNLCEWLGGKLFKSRA